MREEATQLAWDFDLDLMMEEKEILQYGVIVDYTPNKSPIFLASILCRVLFGQEFFQ
jgi:hypothetical protein